MNICFSHALPMNRYNNEDIAKWTDLDEELISEKIGVKQRFFMGENETVASLSLKACEEILNKEQQLLRQSDIDGLILVTQTPDSAIPHTSAILHGMLGLERRVASFDLSLGCSGYVYALSICRSLIAAEECSNILLVTCDPYSKILDRNDRDTISIFGDAATSTLISKGNGNVEIGYSDLGTLGENSNDLTLVEGLGNLITSGDSESINGSFLRMNGRSVFNNMMESVPDSIERCLERNSLKIHEVDFFCFHQASKFILEALIENLEIDKEKVLSNLAHVGNTVSSSIPMLLQKGLDEGLFSGKSVLVCGFGVGLSWGSSILFFK